jgi:hypothetical protein
MALNRDHRPELGRHRAFGCVLLSFAAIALVAILNPAGSVATASGTAGTPRAADTSACAMRISGQPPVRATGHARVLVPPRGIVGARLCRYFGRNHPPEAGPVFTLAASTHVSRRKAQDLAGEFDALRPVHGVRHCPADQGGRLFVRFGYRHRRPVLVKVFLSGCIQAVSGQASRAYEVPSGLSLQLEELAPN